MQPISLDITEVDGSIKSDQRAFCTERNSREVRRDETGFNRFRVSSLAPPNFLASVLIGLAVFQNRGLWPGSLRGHYCGKVVSGVIPAEPC